jgi:hypothetical protein
VGKGPSGGIASYFWEAADLAKGKASSDREVQSAAHDGGFNLDFARSDYWTVVYTRKRKNEKVDTVFALNPHNNADVGEDIVRALQSVGGKDFAAIWAAAGATPVMEAAAVPTAKIVTGLLAQKGGSLVGYAGGIFAGHTDLYCGLNKRKDREIKITIGRPGKRDTYDWAYIRIPGKKLTRIGQMVGTLVDQKKMMEIYKARAVGAKEEPERPGSKYGADVHMHVARPGRRCGGKSRLGAIALAARLHPTPRGRP